MHHLRFCELSISQDDQFIPVDSLFLEDDIYGGDKGLDALGLYFYPQNLFQITIDPKDGNTSRLSMRENIE